MGPHVSSSAARCSRREINNQPAAVFTPGTQSSRHLLVIILGPCLAGFVAAVVIGILFSTSAWGSILCFFLMLVSGIVALSTWITTAEYAQLPPALIATTTDVGVANASTAFLWPRHLVQGVVIKRRSFLLVGDCKTLAVCRGDYEHADLEAFLREHDVALLRRYPVRPDPLGEPIAVRSRDGGRLVAL